MYIDREKIVANISKEDWHAVSAYGDKVYNEIIKLFLSEDLPDISTVMLTIDSCIKDIYSQFPNKKVDLLFEPALQKCVSFMTFVSLFRAKNRDGFTYPEFIFNTFKEYLWEDISNINIKSIKTSPNTLITYKYEEIYRYSEILRKRRNKNLSTNSFSVNQRKNYKKLLSYGSTKGHPGMVYNPIRIEKKSEFELISILTFYSKKEDSRIQDAVDLLAFDRMQTSSLNLDDDLLKEVRSIFYNVHKHKPVSYSNYNLLHTFLYEFFNNNSDYKWLDIYALEKRMCFQGICEIIKTWDLYKNKYNISEEWLIDMAATVLSFPTYGLRIKQLTVANNLLMAKGELSIKELKNIALSINESKNIILSYTLEIFQQAWSKLEDVGLDQSKLNILLKALSLLIDSYADKFDFDLNQNLDSPEYEEIFHKIYNRIYPPFPKQIRTKRKC